MQQIIERIRRLNWMEITESMHQKGYARVTSLLSRKECDSLRDTFSNDSLFRKTIVMERYRFGKGVYKYYQYPLPDLIDAIRQATYPLLAVVANKWMSDLNLKERFPENWNELQQRCIEHDQNFPTPLILQYHSGGFNTLHQDLYGEVFFPIQIVLFLNEPGTEYEGGEFVLTEQVPRAQSKAIVLKPSLGDMLIFTTNFRPVKGTRGYYKANMKHGVSEVTKGTRTTLGIIFHDAKS
jgi:hypothetical protein